MVCHREVVTHQYSRTESCFTRPEVPLEEPSFNDSVIEHGQFHRGCLHKSQRGHPLVAITRADIRTVGLVQSDRPICHSPPPSREDQHSSRPRIQAVSGQQRLDDRSQNYKTVPEELSDGSLRLSSNTTTNKLHQLETRPRGSSLGCLHDALKGTCGICFPSLQLGPHGPQKSLVGPDRDPLDSSNLASSALVASATQSSGTTTCPATKQQTSLEGSNRPFLDSPDVPTSTLIWAYFTSRGPS